MAKEGLWTVKLEDLDLSPVLLRETVDQETVKGLADSIRESGLLQPLLVRLKEDGRYEIIDGHRRYLALKQLGKTMVDCKVVDVSREDALFKSVESNLQRENLNPIEEANAYKLLYDAGFRMEVIGKRLGKDRTYISRMIKLLELPENIKAGVRNRTVTSWTALEFLKLESKPLMEKVFSEQKNWRFEEAKARIEEALEGKLKPDEKQVLEANGRIVPLGNESEDYYSEPRQCCFCGKTLQMRQMRHVWMDREHYNAFMENLQQIKKLCKVES
jgi:ParB family chromosome partitioning protein